MKQNIILHEDSDILVVDKPSGLIVNRSETAPTTTLQEMLEEYFGLSHSNSEQAGGDQNRRSDGISPRRSWAHSGRNDKKGPGVGGRAGIVHRLDKGTSGVLLVAKTEEAFENLQKQFKERSIEKEYTALVHGFLEVGEGEIDASIARNPNARRKMAVVEGGKRALTRFFVLEQFERESEDQAERYSLMRLKPVTGRTHQLRVHMTAMSHPVVSDELYGGRRRSKKDFTWCPRLFLHASLIRFTHPGTGERIEAESELPNDLALVLESLEES